MNTIISKARHQHAFMASSSVIYPNDLWLFMALHRMLAHGSQTRANGNLALSSFPNTKHLDYVLAFPIAWGGKESMQAAGADDARTCNR